jgi:proteic killer suppression protein
LIRSFGDTATEDLYHGRSTKQVRRIPRELHTVALRKLDMIAGAHQLQDLKAPPGNRLESLKGDRKDFYSIRVNDQWRVVFRWVNGNAYEVSIVDYH